MVSILAHSKVFVQTDAIPHFCAGQTHAESERELCQLRLAKAFARIASILFVEAEREPIYLFDAVRMKFSTGPFLQSQCSASVTYMLPSKANIAFTYAAQNSSVVSQLCWPHCQASFYCLPFAVLLHSHTNVPNSSTFGKKTRCERPWSFRPIPKLEH